MSYHCQHHHHHHHHFLQCKDVAYDKMCPTLWTSRNHWVQESNTDFRLGMCKGSYIYYTSSWWEVMLQWNITGTFAWSVPLSRLITVNGCICTECFRLILLTSKRKTRNSAMCFSIVATSIQSIPNSDCVSLLLDRNSVSCGAVCLLSEFKRRLSHCKVCHCWT